MKILLPGFLLTALTILLLFSEAQAQWKLVWADEFHEEIGPDWVFHVGAAWNNELQYYRRENATIKDSMLVITAQKESIGGKDYTSARLRTEGKKSWQYGKLEARIKLPARQGSWPAFWTLGDGHNTGLGWPACGEIDILEQLNTQNIAHGDAHWSNNGNHTHRPKSTPAIVTEWNVYAIEWDPTRIQWFVNGEKFHELSILNSVVGTRAFHDHHHILLNMAVGGNWPGFVIDEENMPWEMYVDYVRVYADTTLIVATELILDNIPDSVPLGQSINFSATVLPEDATYNTVSWASSSIATAIVSSSGVFTARAAGQVTITARNAGLSETRTITIFDPATSSNPITENDTHGIRMYPNPTEDQLIVELMGLKGESTIRVIDMSGRLVKEKTGVDVKMVELNLSGHTGIYMLQVVNNNQVFTQKLSVVR